MILHLILHIAILHHLLGLKLSVFTMLVVTLKNECICKTVHVSRGCHSQRQHFGTYTLLISGKKMYLPLLHKSYLQKEIEDQ